MTDRNFRKQYVYSYMDICIPVPKEREDVLRAVLSLIHSCCFNIELLKPSVRTEQNVQRNTQNLPKKLDDAFRTVLRRVKELRIDGLPMKKLSNHRAFSYTSLQ